MFKNKKTQLFSVSSTKTRKSQSDSNSVFINAALEKAAVTRSGNGAKKFSTTGDDFVDQFGKLGTYKAPRNFADIERDSEILWANDPLTSVKFIHYLRTITRKVQLPDGTTTSTAQRGGELKHEAIFRMLWLARKSPDTFWNNIGLFVALGSWHDIFTMLQYDLIYNGWDGRVLDWKKFGDLILTGLENSNTSELIKKYLPQIKARSACRSVESQANCMIGKWICSLLFGSKESSANYKKYRQLKTSGKAHDWQQLISKKQFDKIDFAKIHGRALSLLVRSKFLKNHGLEYSYAKWVADPNTDVKYTGFVHELFAKLPYSLSQLDQYKQDTINKQFATLVDKGKADGVSSLIVVRDTSGSMGSIATGTNMSCFDIGKALALYFSEFLTGKFQNAWIEFNSRAKMHTWKGNTPLEKWYNDKSSYVGGTNFQSVIDLFVNLKKNGVSEDEFPTGILCISDGEFNPAQLGKTNVEEARNKLRHAGFSDEYCNNFVIVLWNLQSNYYGRGTGEKFETYGNALGTYYFSGYSASVVAFLLNQKIMTARELFDVAMDQEILNRIVL